MNNPRLAGRYAKSLLDIATEQNQLDAVHADMTWLKSICKSNADFVALLRSPIIKADKKDKIIGAITTGRVSALSSLFIQLLVKKSRENNLPEIASAFIDQFNVVRNIRKIKISTATPLSAEIKKSILSNVNAANTTNQNFEIETLVNEALIGGFLLETDGKLVDASVLRDLKDIQKQFMNNDYVHKIR
jgi:F-type H+-transporting ATPase subunit delta